MATRTVWAFRGVLVAAAGGLMAAGIGFAAGGEDAHGLPASAPPTATVVSAARNSPSSSVSAVTLAGSSVPVGPTAVATEPASVTTESQAAPATAASPRPAAEPTGPQPQASAPPPPPPQPPPQVADLPRMTEKAVLALAAGVTMPSGKTFRECVELPPGGEPWPLAIHL